MNAKPRGRGWRGRKRWAWILYGAAWVAMAVGLFLPSYQIDFSYAGEDYYPGWECAWTVTWIWGNVIESGFGDLSYGESLMLSYLPINALFLLAPLFLWLAGRSRRLIWVFRIVYTLIVGQVLVWWVFLLVQPDEGRVLTGYWFWLAAYVLLASAFWTMPRPKPTAREGGEAPAPD